MLCTVGGDRRYQVSAKKIDGMNQTKSNLEHVRKKKSRESRPKERDKNL